jgi:hypothetical protein
MQLQLQRSSLFASPANHAVGPLSVVAVIMQRDSAVQQALAMAKQNECLQSEVRAHILKAEKCQGSCITACCQLMGLLCLRACVRAIARHSEILPALTCVQGEAAVHKMKDLEAQNETLQHEVCL